MFSITVQVYRENGLVNLMEKYQTRSEPPDALHAWVVTQHLTTALALWPPWEDPCSAQVPQTLLCCPMLYTGLASKVALSVTVKACVALRARDLA